MNRNQVAASVGSDWEKDGDGLVHRSGDLRIDLSGDYAPWHLQRFSDADNAEGVATSGKSDIARRTGDAQMIAESERVSDEREMRGRYWPTANAPTGSAGDDWNDSNVEE